MLSGARARPELSPGKTGLATGTRPAGGGGAVWGPSSAAAFCAWANGPLPTANTNAPAANRPRINSLKFRICLLLRACNTEQSVRTRAVAEGVGKADGPREGCYLWGQ